MTSPASTQVHHTVGNDLGGTQRPSGELGWGRLALSDVGSRRQEGTYFQQLTRLMGEAETKTENITNQVAGGRLASDRNLFSVVERHQRTEPNVNQAGGLEIASDPILSKKIANVVFIDQMVPGGSN